MRAWTIALVGLGFAAACGDGGSPLAPDDPEPVTAATGGAGGTGGRAAVTTTGQGGQVEVEEPDGPTAITVVNGIVDADAIRLCLLPYPDGSPSALPWPGPQGLPFSRGTALEPLPTGDLEVVVLAGELAGSLGETCETLVDAPPAGLTVRSVGVVPGSSLEAPRSILLVPAGCVGGEGHEDDNQELICGVGYDPAFGNAGLYAGFMSRLGDGTSVPLQFMHASPALPPVDLRLRANAEAPATLVEAALSLGAIAPFPPYDGVVAGSVAVDSSSIGIFPQGSVTTALEEWTWGEGLANAEVGAADIADGEGLTFLIVGAPPAVGSGTWWQPSSLTVVRSDP